MGGALPDWECPFFRAGSIQSPIPFSVSLMSPVLTLKAPFSCLFMMSGLVGLQLFLRLEQENLTQQVPACLLVFSSYGFSPFELHPADKCYA